jgi:hypothetical protein
VGERVARSLILCANPKGEVRYTDNINFDQDIGDSKK